MTVDPFEVDYPIVTRPDVYLDGSECAVAEHPDLPGCSAHGKDADEAKELLKYARTAYLKYLIEKDLPVPMPSRLRPVEWRVGFLGFATTTVYPAEHWTVKVVANQGTPTGGLAAI